MGSGCWYRATWALRRQQLLSKACTDKQSSEEVHEQTSPHLLVKEWMTERSKDGYSIVATQETDGKYTWVMMSKKGMPCTQQTFMVNEKPFFEQIKEYWKHSFYITSLATVGTHWAAAMSTNTEFKDQYMKSIETTHPFKSWAFGRNGLFTCNGDLDDFQATACAASKSQIITVMSKLVDKAEKGRDKPL
ncbi:g5267 [Coccomyxa viridis]|uniref:G5267 protein n=1 Tax=Coccomyxa viridis TaxID=1274662 RepID=A0ABP1FZ75_9CHLO